jgi:hypothetical protein
MDTLERLAPSSRARQRPSARGLCRRQLQCQPGLQACWSTLEIDQVTERPPHDLLEARLQATEGTELTVEPDRHRSRLVARGPGPQGRAGKSVGG